MPLSTNSLNDQAVILKEMENNIREKLSYIPQNHPDMTVSEINSTLIVDSGLPSDTFNTAFGGIIDLQSSKRVFNYYTNQNYPCAWWIGPSSESTDTALNLKEAGFKHDEYDVGMMADLTQLKTLERPAEALTIKQCQTKEDFNDFGEVLSSIFVSYPEEHQVRAFYNKITMMPAEQRSNLQLYP